MNTDFRVSVSISRNPKIRRLIRRLGTDGFYHLILLWAFTAEIKPDGILSGMDGEEIEEAAEWRGEPGLFYQTLIDLRLLDITETGDVAIHDWQEYNLRGSR